MKNKTFYTSLLASFLTLSSISFCSVASEVVLTGSVSSSAKQIVNAPQGSRWQIQIQWMEEEGKIVQQGEPVVVFDGAIEQNQLTTNKENLDRLELEFRQLELQQEQLVDNAQGRLKVAKMRVEQAKIEASVPASEVSAYDKGQYELALQRSISELVKAEEALQRAKMEQEAELTKKRVDILKTQDEIAYLEDIMTKLKVLADYTGPVSYANHPWWGDKLSAGMNVRPSWKVLDVQATSEFQIESWVHEIDAIGLSEDMPVSIVLDAYPNQTFTGSIKSLSKQSETRPQWSKSAYFPIVVSFDETPSLELLPGMSVRLHVKKESSNV